MNPSTQMPHKLQFKSHSRKFAFTATLESAHVPQSSNTSILSHPDGDPDGPFFPISHGPCKSVFLPSPFLARISHQRSTAAANQGMSPALRSVELLDMLSRSLRRPPSRRLNYRPDAPCIHARLRRLATNPGAECGLEIRMDKNIPINYKLALDELCKAHLPFNCA
jgi:hypothetical protein